MEDQPTDTSDLTEAAPKETGPSAASRGAVPVGKRPGRHRTFRPRLAPGDKASEEKGEEGPSVVEETVAAPLAEGTVEAEAAGETSEAEAAAESPSKPKRRRWFRRRADEAAEVAGPELAEATGAEVTGDEVTGAAEAPTAAVEAGDAGESGEDVEDFPAEESDEAEPKPRERRQAGRRMTIAMGVAAALFVAAGAFGGAMLQPYLADRSVAKTKVNIARTATAAITTLFTYTPDDMDQLAARAAKYLGGDLKDSYAKQVDALAATNKQNQIKRNAQVVGAAVESLNGPNATALVYANVTYTSAATKDVPKIFLVSYRLTMERKGSDWVITNMPWITSKDLTRITP